MFKKLSYITIGVLIGVLISSTFVIAGQPIKLIINNREIKCDQPPQNINGRILVPARALAESLGATVEWDGENNSVVINSKQGQVVGDGSNKSSNPISNPINTKIIVTPEEPNPKPPQIPINTPPIEQPETSKDNIQTTTWNGMNAIVKDGITYFSIGDYYHLLETKHIKNNIDYKIETKTIDFSVNGIKSIIDLTDSNNAWEYQGHYYLHTKFYQSF